MVTTCANATQRRKVVREKGKSSAIVDSDTPTKMQPLAAADLSAEAKKYQ